jgi:hypothetical protein
MPKPDEISDEGFGYFRETWFIGHVSVAQATVTLREEAEILDWLDDMAAGPDDFEQLAAAIENNDRDLITEPLLSAALRGGLGRFLVDDDDVAPLSALEIGVAGLTHALSTVRCLTAASCRWHMTERSWSDCPVVFFAAPPWRVDILAEIVAAEGCGLGTDRDMLTVYAASIRETHRLAGRILTERGRFRRKPDRWRGFRDPYQKRRTSHHVQLNLLSATDNPVRGCTVVIPRPDDHSAIFSQQQKQAGSSWRQPGARGGVLFQDIGIGSLKT